MKYLPAILIILLISISPIRADSYAQSVRIIPKIDHPVKIDGILDEPIWENALRLDANIEVQPEENVPAPVKTEAYLAFSDNYFYAGIKAYDPNPEEICARYSDRDKIGNDDWIALILDTFNSERRSFDVMVNAVGVQSDFIEGVDGDGEWDAIWESAGRICDFGYVVEIAIPFSSLRFQRKAEEQTWGIDIVRSYPRSVRHHIGLFPRDRNNNNYWSQMVKITGFSGAVPGKNFELDPAATALQTNERADGVNGVMEHSRPLTEVGMTGSWGVTPNLTLTTTVNPDFGQVEADAAQLDINSSFALYYPEKRPFFLEGGDFFQSNFNFVMTRSFADPNWGAKLVGKEAAHTIGFMTLEDNQTNLLFPSPQSSDTETLPQKSQGSVFRYKYDFSNAFACGVLATDREGVDYYNRAGGIDGSYRVTKKDQIRFQYLTTQTKYPAGIVSDYDQPAGVFDGEGIYTGYFHGTDGLDLYANFRSKSPGFRADLGFIPQVGMRYYDAGWGYTWHNSNDHWWNMLNIGSGVNYYEETDGSMAYKSVECWGDYSGPGQTDIDFWVYRGQDTYEGLTADVWKFQLWTRTMPTSDFTVCFNPYAGRQIDYENVQPGNMVGLSCIMENTFGRHFKTSLTHYIEKMDVTGGELYLANISYLKLIYQFDRRMMLRTIVQYVDYDYNVSLYDDEQDPYYRRFGSQILFSYKINPQTVWYIGYSNNYREAENVNWTETGNTIFTKIGYAVVM